MKRYMTVDKMPKQRGAKLYKLKDNKDKKFDEILQRHLKNAPKYEGFTIQELSDLCDHDRSAVMWELRLLEAKGRVQHTNIGRAKLYRLRNSNR